MLFIIIKWSKILSFVLYITSGTYYMIQNKNKNHLKICSKIYNKKFISNESFVSDFTHFFFFLKYIKCGIVDDLTKPCKCLSIRFKKNNKKLWVFKD